MPSTDSPRTISSWRPKSTGSDLQFQFGNIPETHFAGRFDSDDNCSFKRVSVARSFNSGTRRANIFEPVVLITCLLFLRIKDLFLGDDFIDQVPWDFLEIKVFSRNVRMNGILQNFLVVAQPVPERG